MRDIRSGERISRARARARIRSDNRGAKWDEIDEGWEKSEELAEKKSVGDRGRDAFIYSRHGGALSRAMDKTRQEDGQAWKSRRSTRRVRDGERAGKFIERGGFSSELGDLLDW